MQSPYDTPPAPPLSGSARLRRGFRRVAIIVSAPLLIVAAGFFGYYFIAPEKIVLPPPAHSTSATARPGLFDDLIPHGSRPIATAEPRVRWQRDSEPLGVAVFLTILSALSYFSIRALGWVLAGFARD